MALWVGRWTCNLELLDLSSVVPISTPPPFVNSQLVSLLPVGIFNKFVRLFTVSIISTTVLNTLTLKLSDLFIFILNVN